MTCAQVLSGRVFVSLEQSYPQSSELQLLRHPDCCGVVLFAENYVDIEQIFELTQEIRSSRREDLFIAVDQEGGRVQRLRSQFTELPASIKLGQLYHINQSKALLLAEQLGWLRARELLAVGIDFSFAPVLDLDHRRSQVIGDRALSRKPEIVSSLGTALIEGAHRAGAIAVAKHYPGHGYARADSHTEACLDDRSLSEIELNDLRPFASAIDANVDGLMSAHINYSQCDNNIATYSQFWTREVLRRRLGFKGILFSDDLCMIGAAREHQCKNTPQEIALRARHAIDAGHDAVLVCKNYEAAQASLKAIAAYRGRGQAFRHLFPRAGMGQPSIEQLRQDKQYQLARDNINKMTDELSKH